MALANKEMVIPASCGPTLSNNLNVLKGTTEVLFGNFTLPAGPSKAIFNNGQSIDAPNELLLRKCAPGTNGANVGRRVRIGSPIGYVSAFVGTIVASIQVEAVGTGGSGTLVDMYLVESEAADYYLMISAGIVFLD